MPNDADADGTTALHWAVHHGDAELVTDAARRGRQGRRAQPLRRAAAAPRRRERRRRDGEAAARPRRRREHGAARRRDGADDGRAHGRHGHARRAARSTARASTTPRRLERTDGADVGRAREQRAGDRHAARSRRRARRAVDGRRLQRPAVRRARRLASTRRARCSKRAPTRTRRCSTARARSCSPRRTRTTRSPRSCSSAAPSRTPRRKAGRRCTRSRGRAAGTWASTCPGPAQTGQLDSLELVRQLVGAAAPTSNARQTKEPADGNRNKLDRLGATRVRAGREVVRLAADGALARARRRREPHDERGHDGRSWPRPASASGRPARIRARTPSASRPIELALEAGGGDVNAIDANGETALHGAVYRGGNIPVIQFLADRGAKLDVVNSKGWTPVSRRRRRRVHARRAEALSRSRGAAALAARRARLARAAVDATGPLSSAR